jgi:hypothetical protein
METNVEKPNPALERQKVLSLLDASIERRSRIGAELNAAPTEQMAMLESDFADASEEVAQNYELYMNGLPRPAISRCPYSGKVFHMSIDTFGLDGPWWNCRVSARPVEDWLPTVFAVTGAVAFMAEVPRTPFVCKPGPGLPYVVPRLLVDPEIRAVVSALRIGDIDAYVTVYFSEDPPLDIARANTWGMDHYLAEDEFGEGYVARIYDHDIDFDYDLEFYIRTGRLMWIAPGDDLLTLRSVVDGCPYIGMSGRQYPVGILDGKMWNSLTAEAQET